MKSDKMVEVRAVVPEWVRDQVEAHRAEAEAQTGQRVEFAVVAGKKLQTSISRYVIVDGQQGGA